ncbi:hypothetical protein N431DRAFT_442067 [Stipitochalara longipes BDJ]|nr:hypothetical protein N431DRAFT_442067 [Stipitochalara longipes BDJ]
MPKTKRGGVNKTKGRKKGNDLSAAGKKSTAADAVKNFEVNQSETSLVAQNDAIAPELEERGAFELFPKLPIELRLRIWTMTFKKQHVELDIRTLQHDYVDLFILEHLTSQGPNFPVALHVNRESRVETLRHYTIICTSATHRMTRATPPPICINLSLDLGSFCVDNIAKPKNFKSYEAWLARLGSTARGGLGALEEPEICHMLWSSWDKAAIESEQENANLPNHPDYKYIWALRIILHFTGLKKICFTWDQFLPNHNAHICRSPMKECQETIQAFMDRHKDEFDGHQAPEVKVRI